MKMRALWKVWKDYKVNIYVFGVIYFHKNGGIIHEGNNI